MRRVNLNLYESATPPTDTKVLWAVKDNNTGDIKAIFKYIKGKWEPYLVSVQYLTPDNNTKEE